MESTHYLTFQVGRQWYGIPVEAVIEVLQMVALDELPSAEPDILGLLTLRNIVMPVLDLRRRFKVADTSLKLETPLIALHHDDTYFAIVVDVVDDVMDTSDATWQIQETDVYITHTVRLNNQLILILDMDQIWTKLE